MLRGDLASCELVLVNEELGHIVFEGHGGPFAEKIDACFAKLWGSGK